METAIFPKVRFDALLEAAQNFDWKSPSPGAYKFDSSRMDAGEAAFFSRQLEHIRPGVMEVKFPELKGTRLVPVDTSVDPGAAGYTYQAFEEVGTALITSDLSIPGPRADVKGIEATQVLRSVVNSYGYSIQEARAAMMARTPLVPRRAMAARDIIERTLDDIIFLGSTVGGLKGLLNLSNTVTFTATTKSGGGTAWENATPDQIVADMNGLVNKIVSDSKELEQPDTLLLPLTSYTLISAKRMGDGDSTTILKHFLASSPYIKTVEATHKSESNSGWTGKRMVAYRRDPMKLAFILPQPFEQLPPQATGYELLTPCHARTGGVVAFYPKSIGYCDEI